MRQHSKGTSISDGKTFSKGKLPDWGSSKACDTVASITSVVLVVLDQRLQLACDWRDWRDWHVIRIWLGGG